MLITLLTLLLISNALSLRADKSIHFSRVVMVSLIHTSFLAYNNLFFIALDKGIGIFGGLLHVTVFTQVFNIFIFILTAIILTLTSFYPRNVDLNEIYIRIVFGLLILLSLKIPFKFMLIALSLNNLYFIVLIISSVLLYCLITLHKQGEYLNAVKLFCISIYSLATYMVFLLLIPDISFIAQCLASIALPNLGLQVLDHSSLNLFSESNKKTNSFEQGSSKGTPSSTNTNPTGLDNIVACAEFKQRCIESLKIKYSSSKDSVENFVKTLYFEDLSRQDRTLVTDWCNNNPHLNTNKKLNNIFNAAKNGRGDAAFYSTSKHYASVQDSFFKVFGLGDDTN